MHLAACRLRLCSWSPPVPGADLASRVQLSSCAPLQPAERVGCSRISGKSHIQMPQGVFRRVIYLC